ncbi:hypothetical protein SYNPS1DRAFT_29112 [Syncephalis pseudoplumigaleata]|uniref:RRM domain-containing protein n=1 Tax=Syncephalis pseudoplumigaleata TaxID=1712513 RepID=A0A4P9YYB6_9FUNG|nr:hypothetical protein SYNPS1DRAFT_29112 [Syncephalis pseudoplumigaleata]|eukprot:RKP25143.1 hypothetical protein SYNPS1DRAFT_29112 [Syncephalis pseudoplumigaleata]
MTDSTATATEAKPLRQRVYLSGLVENVKREDIEQRFRPFGTISDLCISYDSTGKWCRGFAHATLDTTDKHWQRCVTMLNGAKWKGQKLRVEKAKDDHTKRMAEQQCSPVPRRQMELEAAEAEKRKQQRSLRRKAPVKHAADMSLVTDRNVDGRPGWKRGRYGRAIRMMRLRQPNGGMLVYDPAMYKNNLEKLFGSERPLPVERLTWFYPEEAQREREADRHVNTAETEQAHTVHEAAVLDESSVSDAAPMDDVDMAEEEASGSESEHEPMGDVEESTSSEVPAAPSDAQAAADELDTSEEKARSLHILNMMFGGATAQPAASTDATSESAHQHPVEATRQVSWHTCSVTARPWLMCRWPFVVCSAQFNRFLWRDMTQFDPDNPDSLDLLLHPDVPVVSSMDAEDVHDEDNHPDGAVLASTAMPDVGHDKHYTVQGDLKSMFQLYAQDKAAASNGNHSSDLICLDPAGLTGGRVDAAQPFKLFGDQSAETDTASTFSFDFSGVIHTPAASAPQQPASSAASTSTATLPATFFFAHFDQPLLLRRSVYREQSVFMRTGSLEDVTKHWETMRQGLTHDFKQRHKHALRMRKRQQRGMRRTDTRN